MPLQRISEASQGEQRVLFGPMDVHLRGVRERYGVRISARRGVLMLEGGDDRAVRDVTRRVRAVLERIRGEQGVLADDVIEQLLFDGAPVAQQAASPPPRPQAVATGPRRNGSGPARPPAGREAHVPHDPRPLTPNQEAYVATIREKDVVFSIGPAGTGKTYLAVAEAVTALRTDAVRKLVLTRPAVEAGEKLGFLPGDFQAKINPYLRPLYDALGELLPYGEVQRYVDADVIEIVPLAYMRGRTLKDSFIILDEAQNTTPMQMKMFLTRMGFGSKVVVTGDITQVDLPEETPSGLIQSLSILEHVPGIGVIRFGAEDIQRHPLVQRIVDAYERTDRRAPDPS
jgi:phosphate starvation-inducible PhoH-like protein